MRRAERMLVALGRSRWRQGVGRRGRERLADLVEASKADLGGTVLDEDAAVGARARRCGAWRE